MNRLTIGLLATFVAILLGSGLLAYVLRDRPAADTKASAARSENPSSSPNTGETPQAETEKQGKKGSHPLLWELFGPGRFGSLSCQLRQLGSDCLKNFATVFAGRVSRRTTRFPSSPRYF